MIGPGSAAEGHARQPHAVVPGALGIVGCRYTTDPRLRGGIIGVDIGAAIAAMPAAPIQYALAIVIESGASPGARRGHPAAIGKPHPLVHGKVRQRRRASGTW